MPKGLNPLIILSLHDNELNTSNKMNILSLSLFFVKSSKDDAFYLFPDRDFGLQNFYRIDCLICIAQGSESES